VCAPQLYLRWRSRGLSLSDTVSSCLTHQRGAGSPAGPTRARLSVVRSRSGARSWTRAPRRAARPGR
jgi:hypothetical protein